MESVVIKLISDFLLEASHDSMTVAVDDRRYGFHVAQVPAKKENISL